MSDQFRGPYEALRAVLQVLETQGEWLSPNENQKQFRHTNGGIMNWYPSTGSIHFQGKGKSRDELAARVRDLLALAGGGTASISSAPGVENPAPRPLPSPEPSPASNAGSENSVPSVAFLGQRFSDSELVIGLVGAVGTELDKVVAILEKRLVVSHYEVQRVRISRDVIPEIISVDRGAGEDEYARISAMMDAGNRARLDTSDNSILALGAAAFIAAQRPKESSGQPKHLPRRAYIITSLKHPEEVLRLREIYSQSFYLLGVHSNEKRRLQYLVDEKRIDRQKAQKLMVRDEDEHLPHGQRVTDTFHLSDFFVHLDGNDDRLKNSLWRILDILFGDPYKTPTFDEYAMFLAFVASLRSADLSRQVGAVVAKHNEILATGANDCPHFGGGLYWPEFDKEAQAVKDKEGGRDYLRGEDANKAEQQKIIDGILKKAEAEGIDKQRLLVALNGSRIRDLTEFGRVVHAEMEALLCCARNHVTTRGAVLYCTTFPFHNCAKHIIAAGIERVVYVEPYQKSKAAEFHDDAIELGLTDKAGEDNRKVRFEPFVGIGPRLFFDLFSMRLGSGYELRRKDKGGQVLNWNPETAHLRLQLLPCTYLDLELLASTLFRKAKNTKEVPRNG